MGPQSVSKESDYETHALAKKKKTSEKRNVILEFFSFFKFEVNV
jgi:hypothetical protein